MVLLEAVNGELNVFFVQLCEQLTSEIMHKKTTPLVTSIYAVLPPADWNFIAKGCSFVSILGVSRADLSEAINH